MTKVLNFDIILQKTSVSIGQYQPSVFITVTVKDDLFKNLFSSQFSCIYLPIH